MGNGGTAIPTTAIPTPVIPTPVISIFLLTSDLLEGVKILKVFQLTLLVIFATSQDVEYYEATCNFKQYVGLLSSVQYSNGLRVLE